MQRMTHGAGWASEETCHNFTHTLRCRIVPLPTFQRRVKLDLCIAEKVSNGSVLLTGCFWVSQRTSTYTDFHLGYSK